MSQDYCLYILTSLNDTVLYIGVTDDLQARIVDHRSKNTQIRQCHLSKLVYFEFTDDITLALRREKTLKAWSRIQKNKLVESVNPQWRDLTLPKFPVTGTTQLECP